jgi:hypothetical protein
MTSLAEAFGLGRGCFGREGVLRGTGTFPDRYRVRSNQGVISKPFQRLGEDRSVRTEFMEHHHPD